MKNIKIVVVAVLFIVTFLNLKAQDDKKYYAGVNIASPFTQINSEFATKIIMPLFSNLEYGAAVNAGYYFKENQVVETRFSIGRPGIDFLNYQVHFGYNIHILQSINKEKERENKGLYTGIFTSMANNKNRYSDATFNNVFTYITIGYRWDKKTKPLFFDLRLNQTFFAYSWSNIEHSKGSAEFYITGTALTPISPALSLNIGYKF